MSATVNTRTIDWQAIAGTVYGATLDVLSGVLTAYPYYASYNGETLVGPWVSSMDVYAPGTTPTIGAQVVDMGGAETTYQLDPITVQTMLGQNTMWADCGPLDVEYVYDNGEEGGKLALLLRNRKELLIAMRKGAPAAELALGLSSAAPSLGGHSPAVQPIQPIGPIKPVFGLDVEEEDEPEEGD